MSEDEQVGGHESLGEQGPVSEGVSEEVLVLDEAPDPDSVLPVWEPTGHVNVDAALEGLHALDGADLQAHAGQFDAIEASLRGVLDGLAAEDESV